MHQPQASAGSGRPDRNHRFTEGRSRGFGLKPRFLSGVSADFLVLALLFLPIAIPVKSVHAYTLADTGQTKCYNDTDNITCPSPGEPFYGQDGNYNGASPAYKDNGDGTVTDLNTGFMWQQGEGLYNRSWQLAIDYCDSLSLAEHDDWRLPTIEELFSLIKIELSSGNIDREVFPTASSTFYWSSSINAKDQESPLGLHFGYASVYSTYKTASGVHTRCVRGETLPSATYVDNLDGTITDNRTGLIWQQADDGTERDWEQALAYCESLELAGHSDWRLPDYRELMSLADYSRFDPVINPIFDCRSDKYWSSSTFDQMPHVAPCYAFTLNFIGAGSGGSPELKGGKEYVRCVRGGYVTPTQYTLTVTPDPVEGGMVTGPGIKCGTGDEKTWIKCEKMYKAGTKVKLTAKAMDGYVFKQWNNGWLKKSITITMNSSSSLEAEFISTASAHLPVRPVLGEINLGYNKSVSWATNPHNGIDYKSDENNTVLSVGSGIIYKYTKPNASRFGAISGTSGNPGPVIWVKYTLKDCSPIYVLYGHTASSWNDQSKIVKKKFVFNCTYFINWKTDNKVASGNPIGLTAPFYFNGKLASHLHLSVFKPNKNSDGTYYDPPSTGWGYSQISSYRGTYIDPETFFNSYYLIDE